MRRLFIALAALAFAGCLDTPPSMLDVSWEAPCDVAATVLVQVIPDAPRGGDVAAQAVVRCDRGGVVFDVDEGARAVVVFAFAHDAGGVEVARASVGPEDAPRAVHLLLTP